VSDACKHLSFVIDAQLQAKAKMFVAKHKDAEQQLNDANSADFEQLRQLKREV
jgi:7-keto-8-aminopelargonate synthetase-like enzyme